MKKKKYKSENIVILDYLRKVAHEQLMNALECADRHVSCQQWSAEGQCKGNSSSFMAENCRTSCRLCDTLKSAKCGKPLQVT